MANKKITELDALTTPAGADVLAIVDDVAGTATTKQVTVTNLLAGTATSAQGALADSALQSLSAGALSDFDFDDNAILGFSASTHDQTGTTYTVAASDNGKVVVLNNASAITVDIDTGLPDGFNCSFVQKGAGQVSFAGTATVNNRQSHTKINGQYGVASIVAYAADTFVLAGDTASLIGMFVLPTFGLGVIASPTVPPETFDTATLVNGNNVKNVENTITFTVQPSRDISAGDSITLAGLTGSQTADGSLTLSGAGASVFGSAGSWTQSTGTLVLTVDTGQTLSTGSDTVITFNLTNPATVSSGVSGITLSSSGFTQASISGTFLAAVEIFNVTTRNTEANILATAPFNPSGEVNIALGTDTGYYYIYDGNAWYIFNNDVTDPVIITATNTEATILASTPASYTIEQATDTDDLYLYDGTAWYIYNNDS